MQQYPLEFPVDTSYREEDFLPSDCNQAALLAVQEWSTQAQGSFLLRGPKASGKSHLAHIWARKQSAAMLDAADIAANSSPESLFAQHPVLVIENIETLKDEPLLFHLLNMVRQQPYRLLLTVNEEACWDHFTLPDLRSRLQALPQATIHEPDEALLEALLVKQFSDRQRQISPDLPNYLAKRIERSFHAVQQMVKQLESLASSQKRPITVALARQFLKN